MARKLEVIPPNKPLLCGNLTFKFTRHKFLLVAVKEWLKSVLNYRSYPKNKTGYPFFGPPCRCRYETAVVCVCYINKTRVISFHLLTSKPHDRVLWDMCVGDIRCCKM